MIRVANLRCIIKSNLREGGGEVEEYPGRKWEGGRKVVAGRGKCGGREEWRIREGGKKEEEVWMEIEGKL